MNQVSPHHLHIHSIVLIFILFLTHSIVFNPTHHDHIVETRAIYRHKMKLTNKFIHTIPGGKIEFNGHGRESDISNSKHPMKTHVVHVLQEMNIDSRREVCKRDYVDLMRVDSGRVGCDVLVWGQG